MNSRLLSVCYYFSSLKLLLGMQIMASQNIPVSFQCSTLQPLVLAVFQHRGGSSLRLETEMCLKMPG